MSTSFFDGILENATECICHDTWHAKDSSQLTIHHGDHINIVERSNNDWWYGECNEMYGYVPTNYIKLRWENFIDEYDTQTRIGMVNDPSKYQTQIENEKMENIQKNLLEDDDYFKGYESISIHHEMLTDIARTTAYKNAVKSLEPYIKDKIVLDVGCGTGILSMFAAQCGASHVYAVEASPFAFKTRKIVHENGLHGKISVLHGKIEDIFLPVEKVDVIISEWMGTMLITESMICSILFARDKYLKGYATNNDDDDTIPSTKSLKQTKHDDDDGSSTEEEEDEIIIMDDDDDEEKEKEEKKDDNETKPKLVPPPLPSHLMKNVMQSRGLMMPSHCNLYFAPIDLSKHIEEKIDYFDDVYGCSMNTLKNDAKELYLAHATYEIEIDGKNVLSDKPMVIGKYDMYSIKDSDLETLDFKFEFIMNRDGLFCGFSGWFDVIFNPLLNKNDFKNDIITLDTSPHCKRTHWSQTLFPLSSQVKVKKGDIVTGKASFFRNNVSIRHYRMYIECSLKDKVFRKMFYLWD